MQVTGPVTIEPGMDAWRDSVESRQEAANIRSRHLMPVHVGRGKEQLASLESHRTCLDACSLNRSCPAAFSLALFLPFLPT